MMSSYRCHTQLYARLSSYSKLVDLFVDFVYVVSEVESLIYHGFRSEGTFEPTTEMLSREAGPIC
jgi:hypothetical protein